MTQKLKLLSRLCCVLHVMAALGGATIMCVLASSLFDAFDLRAGLRKLLFELLVAAV
jgi:hypothetical protein